MRRRVYPYQNGHWHFCAGSNYMESKSCIGLKVVLDFMLKFDWLLQSPMINEMRQEMKYEFKMMQKLLQKVVQRFEILHRPFGKRRSLPYQSLSFAQETHWGKYVTRYISVFL